MVAIFKSEYVSQIKNCISIFIFIKKERKYYSVKYYRI